MSNYCVCTMSSTLVALSSKCIFRLANLGKGNGISISSSNTDVFAYLLARITTKERVGAFFFSYGARNRWLSSFAQRLNLFDPRHELRIAWLHRFCKLGIGGCVFVSAAQWNKRNRAVRSYSSYTAALCRLHVVHSSCIDVPVDYRIVWKAS